MPISVGKLSRRDAKFLFTALSFDVVGTTLMIKSSVRSFTLDLFRLQTEMLSRVLDIYRTDDHRLGSDVT